MPGKRLAASQQNMEIAWFIQGYKSWEVCKKRNPGMYKNVTTFGDTEWLRTGKVDKDAYGPISTFLMHPIYYSTRTARLEDDILKQK